MNSGRNVLGLDLCGVPTVLCGCGVFFPPESGDYKNTSSCMCFTGETTGFQQSISQAWARCKRTKKMATNDNAALCRGCKISRKLKDNFPFSNTTTNFPRLFDHAPFIRSADNALLTQKSSIERMCHVFSWLYIFSHVSIFAHRRALLVNTICYFSCD